MGGKIICFEGIDGSGKGHQIHKLLEVSPEAVLYQYPDKNWEIGKVIDSFLKKRTRLSPTHQFFLYLSDILKDQGRIKDQIEEGKIIFLDRYITSTLVYQDASGFEMKKGIKIVKELDFIEPDLTILIDIHPEISISRKKKQNGKLEFFERKSFLEKVRKNFLKLRKTGTFSKRWLLVDGMNPPDEISEQINESLEKLMCTNTNFY
ncbi:MAG: dTMP kinase [Candidatus Micrarchaeota archaeon]